MVCDSTACVDFGFLIRAERARANPTTRPASVMTVGWSTVCVYGWSVRALALCSARVCARL